MDGSWAKKQDSEPKVVPSSSKVKVRAPQTIVYDCDMVEKLAIIKDLLIGTQSTVRDIHDISKETSSNVSKIRVIIQKTAKNAVKSFKKVHDRIDGISVSMNADFDRLKKAIWNTLTYFLHRYSDRWMF